ncbi:HAMP domain-containing protein [bacterium]|nr:HAMP domain-containing protein [bacterium]
MFHGLRGELTALLLTIALVPLCFVMVITYRNAEHSLTEELKRGLRAIAERQSLLLNNTVQDSKDQAEILSLAPAVIESMDRLRQGGEVDREAGVALTSLSRVAIEGQRFDNVMLVNLDGKVVYTAKPSPVMGKVLREGEAGAQLLRIFERTRTILETEISDYTPDPILGSNAAFVATPIFSQNRVVGVLVLQMGGRRLLEGVSNYAGLGTSGETIVASEIDGKAMVVAPLRRDRGAAFRTSVPLDGREGNVLALAVQGGRGVGFGIDQEGREVYAVWRYVPAIRWGIVVKVDRSEAFGPVEQLGRLFMWITGITGAVVLALAFSQARRLALPILALRRATQRVAEGDFNVEIEVRSRNEIAELADTFRIMAHRLNENFEDLKRTTAEREKAAKEAIEAKAQLEVANATLEQKVVERTSELSQRNEELVETLAQLKQAQQQLIVRERMASVGEMVAGVAHEMSNPLNFVNNFSDLTADAIRELDDVIAAARQHLPEKDRAEIEDLLGIIRDNLTRISEHGKRAQAIVRGMIELTRNTSGEQRVADLNALVRDYSRVAHQTFRGRGASDETLVEYDLDEALPPVQVHAAGISRSLTSIIGNAFWATGERRQQVGAGYVACIRISTQRSGNEAIISVRDNGLGIPKENLAKVFQPFFTTRPTGTGATGLGLSMAWEIVVNQHAGRLEVISEPGEFTEFRIHLPLKA